MYKDERSVTVRQIADVSIFMGVMNHYSRAVLSISAVYMQHNANSDMMVIG